MFDTGNDPWEGSKAKKKATSSEFNHKFMFGVLVILILAACLIVGLVAVISLGGRDNELDVGLKNPDSLNAPEPVTAEDLDKEYQERPTLDPDTPDVWETAVTKYLSRGDFSGLDSYLRDEMGKYKNIEGDEGQASEDWREKFEMLRADAARAMNLTKDEQPEVTLTQYADPEILAATLAWAPVSVKMDAFADYSSLILPNQAEGDIMLQAVDPSETSKLLQEVNAISPVRYMDLAAYDAIVFGYDIRIVVVANQLGYYRPWNVTALNDDINCKVWSKSTLQSIRMSLDPYSDLGSALPDLPPKDAQGENTKPVQGEAAPGGTIPDSSSESKPIQSASAPDSNVKS